MEEVTARCLLEGMLLLLYIDNDMIGFLFVFNFLFVLRINNVVHLFKYTQYQFCRKNIVIDKWFDFNWILIFIFVHLLILNKHDQNRWTIFFILCLFMHAWPFVISIVTLTKVQTRRASRHGNYDKRHDLICIWIFYHFNSSHLIVLQK